MSARLPLLLLSLLLLSACGKNDCRVTIGETNFSIRPNEAEYFGLNNPGGYLYLTGGHRGIVVVRLAYDRFVAFERTCPEDNSTPVEISSDWGSSLLECPKCHSCFVVENDGIPLDGAATSCPLYQYNTIYSGGELWVY